MLKRILIVISLTLWAMSAQAGENDYQIVGINDPQLYHSIDFARDYKSIKPGTFNEVSQPLRAGDIVALNHSDLSIKMRIPNGDAIWFSGKQAFRLPEVNGVWANLKDALFEVTHLSVAEFEHFVVQSNGGRYNITAYDDGSVLLQVYEGAATIRAKSGAQKSVPARFWVIAKPGQSISDLQPLDMGAAEVAPVPRSVESVQPSEKKDNGHKVQPPNSESIEVSPTVKVTTLPVQPKQIETEMPLTPTHLAGSRPPMPGVSNDPVRSQRPVPLPPAISQTSGNPGFFSRLISSPWFYVGTGLVASGVGVAVATGGSSDGQPPTTPLSELPGPPNPGGN